ncbi:MAG: hypothetical protein FJW39_13015 [Acidobacteria bacterium]|nr:hypothetical protein [Acidobacteriota bacterium]
MELRLLERASGLGPYLVLNPSIRPETWSDLLARITSTADLDYVRERQGDRAARQFWRERRAAYGAALRAIGHALPGICAGHDELDRSASWRLHCACRLVKLRLMGEVHFRLGIDLSRRIAATCPVLPRAL